MIQERHSLVQKHRKTGDSGDSSGLDKIRAQEPERLESLLIGEQIKQHVRAVEAYVGPGLSEVYLASEADYAD